MVLAELIDEIIELTIYSAYVKSEKPVSLLLVASPEAGKTKSVLSYQGNQGLFFLTDCTASGILEDYQLLLKANEIRHFIFTDLITPISKNVDTRNSLIAFLNGMVEDGILEVHTKFNHYSIPLVKPVGMIACIAPEPLKDNRRHWKNIGFMSRMIPFSWSYSLDTQAIINESIDNEEYHDTQPIILDLPTRLDNKNKAIPYLDFEAEINLNSELAKKLREYVELRTDKDNPYGFRMTKQLHTLAKASALKDKRDSVQVKDIDKIRQLSGFMNMAENEI